MAVPSEILRYTPATGDSGRRRMYSNQDPKDQVNTAFNVHESAFDRDTVTDTSSFSVGGGQSTLNKEGASFATGKLAALKELGLLKYAYKLDDRLVFRNLDISIENKKGGIRKWFNPQDNTHGEQKMTWPYGYIRMTEGMDGDHVDCFIGPNEQAKNVYVITTARAPNFRVTDEQKCMLGFNSAEEAKKAFLENYNNPKFFKEMKTLTYEEFERKALATKDSNRKKIAELSIGRAGALTFLGSSVLLNYLAKSKNKKLFDQLLKDNKTKLERTKSTDLKNNAFYVINANLSKEEKEEFKKETGVDYKPGKIVFGKNVHSPGILAHELGHSELDKTLLGKLTQNEFVNSITGSPYKSLVTLGVGFLSGLTGNKKLMTAGKLAPLLISVPELASEAGASVYGIKKLKESKATNKELFQAGATLTPAFGTYLGNAMMELSAASTGVALGELVKNQYKIGWYDEPRHTDVGPSHDAVPGDYLGLPRTSLVGLRSVKGDNMAPQDKILNAFRFMDHHTDTNVLDGNTQALPSDPAV